MKPGISQQIRLFFKQTIRNTFSGIFLIIPLVTTLYVFIILFQKADSALPQIFHFIFPKTIPRTWSPGIGIFLTLLIAYFIGLLAKNYLGRKIISIGNALIATIPLVNKVYLGIQQIMDAFSGKRKKVFEKTVLVRFPLEGSYSIGFMTADASPEISRATGEQMVCVFLPTTPNPTSGYLLVVPKANIIPLEINTETALKMVMSAGVLSSEQMKIAESAPGGGRLKWTRIFKRLPPENKKP
jgi:uncharacterized membrane protein